MATVALSTTPTQIDDGTSYTVLVANTGAVTVDLSRGGRLRPGQTATVYPEGSALTAATTSGAGSVTTSTTVAPTSQAAQVAANTAAIAGLPGTYAALRNGIVPGNTFAALGDSITAANGSAPSTPSNSTSNGEAWHLHTALRSSGRIRWISGFATGGFTVQQIRDTNLPSLLAFTPRPDAVAVLGGTNNLTGIASGGVSTLTSDFAVLVGIYDSLEAVGIRPIACTVPPRGDSATAHVAACQWNTLVRNKAAERGYALLDFYSVLVDPATGAYRSGWGLVDGVHPSYLGHKMMGAYAAPKLAGWFPPAEPPLIGWTADTTDLLGGQGMFAVDTNADGVSDGWSNIGTPTGVTWSRSTDADGYVWQRLTCSDTSSASMLLQKTFTAPAAGSVLEFSGKFRTSGFDALVTPTTGVSHSASLDIRNGSNATVATSGYGAPRTDFTDGWFHHRVTLPSDVSGNIRANLSVGKPTTTGTVYVEFSRLSVRNLTTLGLTGV